MVHMFETQLILCNSVHLSIFLMHCLEIFVIKLLLSAKISYSTGCVIVSYNNCLYFFSCLYNTNIQIQNLWLSHWC